MNLLTKKYKIFSALFIPLSFGYYFLVSKLFLLYASGFSQKTLFQKAVFLLFGIKSVIFAVPLITFGFQEFALRIPSLIAYTISSIVLYLLVLNHTKNKTLSLYSALILLFLPGFFYYGSLAYGVPILTLSAVSSLYFLLKYQKTRDFKFVFYTFLVIALSITFDKKAITILGAIIFFILIDETLFKKKTRLWQYKDYLFSFLLSISVFSVYFVLNSLYFNAQVSDVHGSLLVLSNLINVSKLIRFPLVTHYITSFIGLIVLIPSALYSLYLIKTKKDKLNIFLWIFYLTLCLFFTAQRFAGLPRYIVPASFGFAFLIAQFLVMLEKKFGLIKVVSIIFIIVLAGTTIYSSYHNVYDRYLPMNGLFGYIKEQTPEGAKFLKTMAPSSYNFYILRYNLNFNNFDPTVWQPAENQTLQNLYDYMEEKNMSYAFFPTPEPSYDFFFYKPNPSSWLDLWQIEDGKTIQLVNHTIINSLYENTCPLFKKKAEFHLGRNTLFLVEKI